MKIENYKPELFSIADGIINQKRITKEKDYPHFAPDDGYCWHCKKNIYVPLFWKPIDNFRTEQCKKEDAKFVTGITIEAAKKHITGCPHCHRTYCG
jgi:hypothetical protein